MQHQKEFVVRLNLLGEFIFLEKINLLVKLKEYIAFSTVRMFIEPSAKH